MGDQVSMNKRISKIDQFPGIFLFQGIGEGEFRKYILEVELCLGLIVVVLEIPTVNNTIYSKDQPETHGVGVGRTENASILGIGIG